MGKKVIAVIGLIAALITILVFVTGKFSLKEFFQEDSTQKNQSEVDNISEYQNEDTLIIGGQPYNVIKIGNQIWMAENLQHYVSGCKRGGLYAESIYYSREEMNKVDEEIKGWHVPSNEEWETMLYFLGSSIKSENDTYYNFVAYDFIEKIMDGGESGLNIRIVGDLGCAPCKRAVYWSSDKSGGFLGYNQKSYRWVFEYNGYSIWDEDYTTDIIGCYEFDSDEFPEYSYYLIRLIKD